MERDLTATLRLGLRDARVEGDLVPQGEQLFVANVADEG